MGVTRQTGQLPALPVHTQSPGQYRIKLRAELLYIMHETLDSSVTVLVCERIAENF